MAIHEQQQGLAAASGMAGGEMRRISRGDRPRGQIDEHTRSRVQAIQDRSLVSAAVAQFDGLENGLRWVHQQNAG